MYGAKVSPEGGGGMMSLTTLGSIQNSIRYTQLTAKPAERKQVLSMDNEPKDDPLITELNRQLTKSEKSRQLSSIDTKLRLGSSLTPAELDYLREHAPLLYDKAVHAEREREEYRRALKACRSKEEVERLNQSTHQRFLMEARTVSGNPKFPAQYRREQLDCITIRAKAIDDEDLRFRQSSAYATLPKKTKGESTRTQVHK